MVWPFRRKTDDMSVESLLARAEAASPTRPAAPPSTSPPAAPSPGVVPADPGFRMTVVDVFVITGRGTVVTGVVEGGPVAAGQTVRLVRGGQVLGTITVTSVEKFRAVVQAAAVGDNVGLFLDRVSRSDLLRGDLLTG